MLFLSLEEPPTTKAPGILAVLDNAFTKFDCPNWKNKLIGFCSKGACVNMGHVRGVSTLLMQQSPWIISVWCLANRLELAVKDTFKSTYMDTVIEILTLFTIYINAQQNKTEKHKNLLRSWMTIS